MKKVKINEQGFLESPYIIDASIEKEVDEETYEKIMSCKIGMNWRLINGAFAMVDILDEETIRERRQIECFNFVDNRSQIVVGAFVRRTEEGIERMVRGLACGSRNEGHARKAKLDKLGEKYGTRTNNYNHCISAYRTRCYIRRDFRSLQMVLKARETRQRHQSYKGRTNTSDLWCPCLLKRPKRARLRWASHDRD